jgi:hypothetical protein
MMDPEVIKKHLQEMLSTVAAKARADAESGESDISSVFNDESTPLPSLDVTKIEEAIRNIEVATSTKEGARRLINGVLLAAKVATKVI